MGDYIIRSGCTSASAVCSGSCTGSEIFVGVGLNLYGLNRVVSEITPDLQ